MKPNSLEEFYTKVRPAHGDGPGTLLASGVQREIGHFNVFNVADLMATKQQRPP